MSLYLTEKQFSFIENQSIEWGISKNTFVKIAVNNLINEV
jgi:hypothetical protein